jgi:predicted nicotinamide N-methyase
MEMNTWQTALLHIDIMHITAQLLRVTNVDELFEALVAKGEAHADVQDERIPYWAELWPAAIALSMYLVQAGAIKATDRVTEIGCGLGLPGIIAGKLGATVTFTDYLEEPLQMAQRNWYLNHSGVADFHRMDWRQPDPALAADVVLASDITYEKRFLDHLPQAFRTLCRPEGQILVSDPERDVAQSFFENIEQAGFTKERFTFKICPPWSGLPTAVSVYKLQCK